MLALASVLRIERLFYHRVNSFKHFIFSNETVKWVLIQYEFFSLILELYQPQTFQIHTKQLNLTLNASLLNTLFREYLSATQLALFELLTYLEVNDDKDDENCSEEVWKVRCVLSVEGVLKSVELVALGKQEVEESNNSSLEFSSLFSSNGDWWETLP